MSAGVAVSVGSVVVVVDAPKNHHLYDFPPSLDSLSLACAFSVVEGGPVGDVEDEEDDGEGDEHGHVHLARLVLLNRGADLAEGLDLHLEQDYGVLGEGAEDEEDAADHPGLHGVQTVGLRGVGRGSVEDVHL